MFRLHTDGVNFSRARNRIQTMIKNKRRDFISNKLTEHIAKPKELYLSRVYHPNRKQLQKYA